MNVAVMTLQCGIKDRQKLEKPIFTPSTKAKQGAHDKNISPKVRLVFFR